MDVAISSQVSLAQAYPGDTVTDQVTLAGTFPTIAGAPIVNLDR